MRRAFAAVIALTLAGCVSGPSQPEAPPSKGAPPPAQSKPPNLNGKNFNSKTVNASFGTFEGELWLSPPGCEKMPGKACTLVSDLRFKDSAGTWHPKKDKLKTDGASIPAFAQPLIGGRYDARYVAAAVVHDYYYNRHVRTYAKTQRQYYNASRALGTDPATAAAMYYAILVAGEAWVELETPESCPQPDATCVRNNPLPAGITMKSVDGKLYATQHQPVDSDMKEKYRRFANDAKAMRSTLTYSEIEARAARDFPNNILLQLSERQKATVQELTMVVMRARGQDR
jgi:hypothetical protein